MVRNLASVLAIGALTIGTAAAFGACSKEDSPEKPTVQKPSTVPVVSAVWGGADGQLGRDVPEQGLPTGPKTLVVESNGLIRVLDNVNHRIQSFNAGAPAGAIKIPERPFEDLELDGNGGFVLLDLYEQAALVFVGADGSTKSEVPLLGPEIPEPTLTTALVRGPDGFYVEVEDDFLVRIADPSGAQVEQELVPGQAFDDSGVLKVEADEPNQLSILRFELPDGEMEEIRDLDVHDRVAERTLFTVSPSAGIVLAVRLESEQSDPEKPPTETHRLFVLDGEGSVTKRLILPNAGGPEDIFRPVRMGEDGNVYVMSVTETGVEIGKVAP